MSETILLPKNPSLASLNVLIGKWSVTMTHNSLPHPLTWQDSFEWIENAFILWHWQGKNEVPKAQSIIGHSDNSLGKMFKMFYYDSRGVSRIFDMAFDKNIWKFRREDTDFFQRFERKISEDGNTITGEGENSYDAGKNWKHDFDITYTRIT